MDISVVIPLYKCSDSIQELNLRIITTFEKIDKSFEIIYVNDASPQNDWEIVKKIALNDKRIKGLSLSRNFGQHSAITAGLQASKGEWIVVMDGDLQDQPEEILKFLKKSSEGYDVLLGQRVTRKDRWLKRILSKIFYWFFSYLTETPQDPTIANFGMYHKNVIHSVLEMKDFRRFFPAMIHWVGFKTARIPVEHSERSYGKTAYSFKKLLHLAFSTILAFSDKPLRITVKIGVMISFISFCLGLFYFIRFSIGKIFVSGFTSLIISIWFLAGVIISILGMIGLYIGNIFEKVKDRPLYIVRDSINI